jgi:hypothetical protein
MAPAVNSVVLDQPVNVTKFTPDKSHLKTKCRFLLSSAAARRPASQRRNSVTDAAMAETDVTDTIAQDTDEHSATLITVQGVGIHVVNVCFLPFVDAKSRRSKRVKRSNRGRWPAMSFSRNRPS